jgi:diguanylate cyclase (GGDEF)-like protein
MAAVGRVARALASGDDARTAVCEAACEVASAPVAFLLEPSGRELISTAMHGVDMAPVTIQAREETPRGAAKAFSSLESYFVADARDHPALSAPLVAATDAHSALFEPVVRDGAVSGVMILIWRTAVHPPGDSLNAVLRLIAAQAAIAIEHSALRDRLGELALSEPLTGLATLRMFEAELPRELARARRAEMPVCVAVLDLDGLGAFNMLRGEREGDRLLKETGASWAGALRDIDLLARMDGGRFAALLPGCMLGEACEVVDRVRGLTPRNETASAGVAQWNGEEPAELLLARAENALAAAKAAGRDMTLPAD